MAFRNVACREAVCLGHEATHDPSAAPPPLTRGALRRLQPLDAGFGSGRGRGTSIDKHYIEGFPKRHAADVHVQVLEVADDRLRPEL